MIGLKAIVLSMGLLGFTGCVVHDPRIEQLQRHAGSALDLSGRYKNLPTYWSTKEKFGESDRYAHSFSVNVGSNIQNVTEFVLSVNEDGSFTAAFIGNNDFLGTVKVTTTLRENGDGRSSLVFDREYSSAGGDSSLQLGVESRRWELFLNNDNDLVFAEYGAGAGLFLIVPYAISVEQMAIYEKIEEKP